MPTPSTGHCIVHGCRPGVHAEMAVGRELADFDHQTVGESGVTSRDGGCFVESADEEFHVAADCLLGLREGAVRHPSAARSGDDTRVGFEGLTLESFSLGNEVVEPGVPAGDDLLALFRARVGELYDDLAAASLTPHRDLPD
jgi:hypothetical protein